MSELLVKLPATLQEAVVGRASRRQVAADAAGGYPRPASSVDESFAPTGRTLKCRDVISCWGTPTMHAEQPTDPTDPSLAGPSGAPFPVYPVPPELLAWAQQTFDMEEFMEDVREIEETGGHKFEDFIAEVEARVRGK